MTEKNKKPNGNQKAMIRRRGLDPSNYLVIKDTLTSLYLLDVRYNKVKILYKQSNLRAVWCATRHPSGSALADARKNGPLCRV